MAAPCAVLLRIYLPALLMLLVKLYHGHPIYNNACIVV